MSPEAKEVAMWGKRQPLSAEAAIVSRARKLFAAWESAMGAPGSPRASGLPFDMRGPWDRLPHAHRQAWIEVARAAD